MMPDVFGCCDPSLPGRYGSPLRDVADLTLSFSACGGRWNQEIVIEIPESEMWAFGTTENWDYEEKQDGTLAVIRYKGGSTDIKIPRWIDEKEVTEIKSPSSAPWTFISGIQT